MTRDQAIRSFLSDTPWASARIDPLAQDASFRRYWRLTAPAGPAVLMDAPPPEDVRPFLRIGAHLATIGLSVPAIHKADPDAGLVLEEDLGDGLLAEWFDAPHHPSPDESATMPSGNGATGPNPPDATLSHPPRSGADRPTQATLLHAAAEALIPMQRAAPPHGLPAWSTDAMTETALAVLFDWWWPARHHRPAPDAARAAITAALRAVLAPLADGPRGFVHRDYFGGNLLWLAERPMPRAIGIIDFQGAAIGHPAYDLTSLLQDARRDIPPDIAAEVLDRYLSLRPDLDPAAFRAAYAACAAQRHLRVACQWVRLALRDHRPHYLAFGPRTWALLTRALEHPAVAPLKAELDRWVPICDRANPSGLPA